ncbi:MAG: hypothetical protein ACUVRD_00525 [Bacteroidia bacterium]
MGLYFSLRGFSFDQASQKWIASIARQDTSLEGLRTRFLLVVGTYYAELLTQITTREVIFLNTHPTWGKAYLAQETIPLEEIWHFDTLRFYHQPHTIVYTRSNRIIPQVEDIPYVYVVWKIRKGTEMRIFRNRISFRELPSNLPPPPNPSYQRLHQLLDFLLAIRCAE